MGSQQIFRAAHVLGLLAAAATTASAAGRHAATNIDRVAVIDAGPADEKVRQQLAAAVVAAGLSPVIGDGIEDALGGVDRDRDSTALAAAMADAQSRFGALACKETIEAAQKAIAIGAARQAAELAVPELPRAWTYVLLCADRTGDAHAAQLAATNLRALGGSPDADARVLDRYPEIDALSDREVVALTIDTEVAGADVFVDFKPVGKAPVKLVVNAGAHVIAAGAGTRRGVLTGTVVRTQPALTVPMPDQAGPYAKLAARVASWHGAMPPPADLEAVMSEVGVRVAVVRHGDTIEAWGHAGHGERLRRLGEDDGVRPLAEAKALCALIADRIATWNSRAPDPDQPLLVETPQERASRYGRTSADGEVEEPTKWWVYATIGGALLAGAIIVYAHESGDQTQRIEVHYP